MRHDRVARTRESSILTRKRFQFAGALVIGALVPWLMRGPLPGLVMEPASIIALVANVIAVVIAFWMRLSIETYPGIRRSYVIFPSALTGHGITLVWFVLTRFPYDRLALLAGFVLHGDAYRPLDVMLAEIDAVTAEDVAAVAREFFAPERQTIVSLGPGEPF